MKKILFILPLIIGCGSATSYFQSNNSTHVIDSIKSADNVFTPNYYDWNYSSYLTGDSAKIKVFRYSTKKDNKTYIFSIVQDDSIIVKSNVRIEK